eukprot:CAMPEP_0182440352 /NCGR_PEP_ID=MMETSP1167-20130531/87011_1 /TAXON_ID=2988 /ORGANISM="Mallomonas Sp, Strain CCMP3275" /LENGTH=1295 /DNA_ID=CAMNT_0024634289 /DNA_START=719 /DNA_END=4606 /DNA_ORIENTATION=-
MYSQLKEVYGPNKFQMSSPAFLDLYYLQITSPFTVFQLFCSLLWCLDEYWQYSLFTLFMIFTFEATTVFQRLQSMKMLKGMGNEPRPIRAFRYGKWREVSTEELVPGDVFSLVKTKDDVIPCDAIILYGSAVVNESSLTGESVPQMKDGIAVIKGDLEVPVSIKGEHKVHALFGGTRLLQVTSMTCKAAEALEDERDRLLDEGLSPEDTDTSRPDHEADDEHTKEKGISPPPDEGCVCYVTRTGFSSSQGKLVRMIESSQASVQSDTRDTVALLLMLLVFALISSGYVLYKGMQDGTQSRYQLLLHCILIVTSVIPPELPMQTALAVNNSLMTLMKMQIFCTEPFRVPYAGKVDTCVFDKTGTLTTDELVAVGVVSREVSHSSIIAAYNEALRAQEIARSKPNETAPLPGPTPVPGAPAAVEEPLLSSVSTAGMSSMTQANAECTLVLGACHSLVLIDGKVGGDPLEVASLRAIQWEVPPLMLDTVRPKPENLVREPKTISFQGRSGLSSLTIGQVRILARHHFSSKLQRMSVVVKITGDDGSAWVLVKGSPEALFMMCTDCPSDFNATAADLAKRGMRVIALGLRRVSSEEIAQCCESRTMAETKVHFAGFVSFTCRVRKDTATVVRNLRGGGHVVAMATGDAMLTAVHVAKEVGITTQTKKGVLLLESDETGVYWCDYESGTRTNISFDPSCMTELSAEYDLCVSGRVLMSAMDTHPELSSHLNEFVVYARMRPDEKERVLLAMKDHGHVTLMCGDGANDVGALKQAHVGVALLSGFGDLNVNRDNVKKKEEEKKEKEKEKETINETAVMTTTTIESDQELLSMKVSELKKRLRLLGVEPDDHPHCVEKGDIVKLYKTKYEAKKKDKSELQRQRELMAMTPKERQAFLANERKELALKKQKEFQEEYERQQQLGESWPLFKAIKIIWDREAVKAKQTRAQNNSITGSAGKMASFMDGMQSMEELEQPMIKIGDASVASPFTSKMPSICGSLDIIRQGRCTLVTTIQMYQILALNCLINAYSLSVLRLDGIKYGDVQMTCLGILMSVSFITISRSKPLQQLSPVRPLRSIFHPALFLSLMGQFALHLVTMIYLVSECKRHLSPEEEIIKSKVFSPNLVNSVVFLVTAVQQVSVFVVNLKGPPFMGGLSENSPLLYSLVTTFIGTFMCASEYIPQMNKFLQLVPFPSGPFRNMLLAVLGVDVLGAFLWDRLMLGIFAFPLLKASLASTTKQDVYMMVRVVVLVFMVVSWLGSMDYTEIAKELERQEKEAAAAAVAGRGVETDTSMWSASISGKQE